MIDCKDLKNIVPITEMIGEDDEETRALHEMLKNATRYIQSFDWSVPIEETYFGGGIGNIVAVFLFKFSKKINNSDDWLWVVEGDLPSAYLVTDIATSPSKALNCYCELMNEWVDNILIHNSTKTVFPVYAEPSVENANLLLRRIKYLRKNIIPLLDEGTN